jgi:thiol-disulfide isomerase/thioredoxin
MKWNILLIIGLFIITGCTVTQTGNQIPDTTTQTAGSTPSTTPNTPIENSDWKQIELKDVRTGESFKISDFEGKPILLESFAVWCPTCTRQQNILKELHNENPEIISISLDTDPNEDESKVLEHINRNDFDWRYAISPIDLTQALIDDFGVGVVNAPSVPIILICEDQSTKLLDRGLKSVDKLKEEIAGC